MSDPLPPPEPAPAVPHAAHVPPQPFDAAPTWTTTPAGYVPYSQYAGAATAPVGRARPTAPFRWAATLLMWLATAATIDGWVVSRERQRLFDDPSSSFQSLVDADDRVALSTMIYALFAVLTAGALAMWAHRVVTNNRLLGEREARPGLAAGGWFIPFANAIVPYIQLRRSARYVGANLGALTLWQVCWAAMVVLGFVSSVALGSEPATPNELSTSLSVEVTFAALVAVAAVVAAAAASISMHSLDRASADRRELRLGATIVPTPGAATFPSPQHPRP